MAYFSLDQFVFLLSLTSLVIAVAAVVVAATRRDVAADAAAVDEAVLVASIENLP